MSFILDALRKSENARLRQEHPAMFDARPVAARRRFPAWFLALGLLLGLNLLALLYVLLRDERSAATPRTGAPVATDVVAAPVTAVPTIPQSSASPPPVAPAVSPPAQGGGAVTSSPVTPSPVTTRPTVAAVPSRAASAASAAPVAAPAAAPARTRDDLLAAGDAVPDTQVSLHVYDADPAKRFVFLNGQRLREGDVAANGLRVERIDADGVVLDHRGSDFKVPLEP